ncbi:MAG: HU family DNA-binding protein [Planctomycetota bacterium]
MTCVPGCGALACISPCPGRRLVCDENETGPFRAKGAVMHTVTKKELVDRIADQTDTKRVTVKRVVQSFLDEVINELGRGNRLEFRDFGVFETKERAARIAQNPKTLQRVHVPPKRTVRFKMGRLMKVKLQQGMTARTST